METLSEILSRMEIVNQDGISKQPLMLDEQWRADGINDTPGNLEGLDCSDCKNRGYIAEIRNETVVCVRCKCMDKRESLLRIAKSGLSAALEENTLDKYQTPQAWQREAKKMAEQFIADPRGWFCAMGAVGSGKTHLCTAIAGDLLKQGMGVKYMLWRDEAVRIKACVTDDEEYHRLVNPLKTIKCLYIDDFFKGNITPADINLAFEILNSRYNDRKLITIISSEKTIEDLLNIDEAIGSRIYERSKGYYVRVTGDKNWRLKS